MGVQGHLDAAYQLGVIYLNGWGERASRTQAINCWTLAANYGHVLAMYNLAMLHLANPCVYDLQLDNAVLLANRAG